MSGWLSSSIEVDLTLGDLPLSDLIPISAQELAQLMAMTGKYGRKLTIVHGVEGTAALIYAPGWAVKWLKEARNGTQI